MIATGGVDAVALRPLAAACGCTTSTIYSLFGNRDGLIQAVVQHVSESFGESQHAVRRTADPLTDLMGLGRAYRSWALENPAFYQVMFARVPKTDCEPIAPKQHPSIEPLMDAVARSVDTGVLGGGQPDQITRSIWAGVHGWVALELIGAMPRGQRKSVTEYSRHLRSLLAAWRPD